MKSLSLAFVGFGLMAAATSAGASNTSEERFAADLRDFGACMVKSFPDRAALLLTSEPGTRREQVLLRRFFRSAKSGAYCWPRHRAPEVTAPMIRGAVAEAMYRMKYKSLPRHLTGNLPAGPRPPAQGLGGVARCVVAADPGAVDDLLRQKPDTDLGRASLAALKPVLGNCSLRDTDWRPLALRGALAEHLYARSREANGYASRGRK